MVISSYTSQCRHLFMFFFFNDTATTEIYTLSLHDALPISRAGHARQSCRPGAVSSGENPPLGSPRSRPGAPPRDRKSTRLNSSHSQISYAVFCLKKKNIVWHHLRTSVSCLTTRAENVTVSR